MSSKNVQKKLEKGKERKEGLNNKNIQLLEAGAFKESDNQGGKSFKNSKIRKNQVEKIEGKDSKNHIFETDFPDEENLNKDIRYNHDLLIKNEVTNLKDNNLNKNNKITNNVNYDYNSMDNGKNAINNLPIDNELTKNINNNNYYVNEKNSYMSNKHNNDDNFNLNVGLNIKSNFDLNNYYKDNLIVDEFTKKKMKIYESSIDNNKTDDLYLNIYTNKQMSLNNIEKDKMENGRLNKHVRFSLYL